MTKTPVPKLVKYKPIEKADLELKDRTISLWEEFIKLQTKASTRKEYAKNLKYFHDWASPGVQLSKFFEGFLTAQKKEAILKVMEWRQYLIEKELSSATINLRLSAIKSFVKYAGLREACSYSLGEIKLLKSEQYKDTRGVSIEDYRLILGSVDRSTDLGRRDYGILRLLWDNGLRREEVVNLDLDDYTPETARLMVSGKGKHDKCPVGLNRHAVEALDEWVAFRKGQYFKPKKHEQSPALFLSYNGKRLTGAAIFKILKGYGDQVGAKNVSPHSVRHGAVTAFLDASNGDVRSAKSFTRHQRLDTLMLYDDNRQELQENASETLGDLLKP